MALDPQLLKNMNKWARDIANDNDFHYVRYNLGPEAHECPICKKHKKGKYYGWNCIGFAWAVWHHGGGLGNKCSCDAIDNSSAEKIAYASSDAKALAIARRRLGINDIKVIRNGHSDVPRSKWEPGDVCLKFSGSTYTHTYYYYGDDYIVDSTSGSYIGDPNNIKKRHKSSSYGARVLIRYVGNKKGDSSGSEDSDSVTSTPTSAKTTTVTVTAAKSTGNSKSASDVKKGAVAWANKIANDNSFHYGYGKPAHHNGCYFCGTNTLSGGRAKTGIKDYKKTYCGNPFVHAAFAHGGGEPTMLRICQSGSSYDYHKDSGYDTSNLFEKISPKPKKKDLQPGDVLCKDTHVVLYVGDEKIAEAHGGDDNKKNSDKWNNSIRVKKLSDDNYATFPRIYRYIGPGGGSMEIPTEKHQEVSLDDGSAIVLKESIAKLYSSANYEYANVGSKLEEAKERKKEREKEATEKFSKILSSLEGSFTDESDTGAISETVAAPIFSDIKFEKNKPKLVLKGKSTNLLSFPTLVEAPTIVLDFNGIKIGGYNNGGDVYPNYIVSMSINKVNGRINQYSISLSYQIRPGEDPNFIDKLLSRVGYTNPLKILYGDSNFPNRYFREESAIITDVKQNEDISSYRIQYTITAVSSITASQASLMTFKPKTTKPSTAIYDLLYSSGEISRNLLEIFPGMRNKNLVASKNLIPTNDEIVSISGMSDASPFAYLSTLVACMKNSVSNSTYFLNFVDDSKNELGGSYFKISEVQSSSNTKNPIVAYNYYELDINYPVDNFITNFQLCTDTYWPLVYQYAGTIPKFQYGIDDMGNITQTKINPLYISNKFKEESLINDNWWRQVTEFPISAKVTLKGLLNPIMIMSYIKINALFYGREDMASGLYVVTQQDDSISGSGYTTELTLLKVSN